MFNQKREVYEMLKELKECIYTIDDIGGQSYKDSEDLENCDRARNRAMEILENLENYIDIVPLP